METSTNQVQPIIVDGNMDEEEFTEVIASLRAQGNHEIPQLSSSLASSADALPVGGIKHKAADESINQKRSRPPATVDRREKKTKAEEEEKVERVIKKTKGENKASDRVRSLLNPVASSEGGMNQILSFQQTSTEVPQMQDTHLQVDEQGVDEEILSRVSEQNEDELQKLIDQGLGDMLVLLPKSSAPINQIEWISWQDANVAMINYDSLEKYVRKMLEIGSHSRYCNLLSLLMRFIESCPQEVGKLWRRIVDQYMHSDIKSFLKWIVKREKETYHILQDSTSSWSKLSKALQKRYCLLQLMKTKVDTAESIVLLLASRSFGMSFSRQGTIRIDERAESMIVSKKKNEVKEEELFNSSSIRDSSTRDTIPSLNWITSILRSEKSRIISRPEDREHAKKCCEEHKVVKDLRNGELTSKANANLEGIEDVAEGDLVFLPTKELSQSNDTRLTTGEPMQWKTWKLATPNDVKIENTTPKELEWSRLYYPQSNYSCILTQNSLKLELKAQLNNVQNDSTKLTVQASIHPLRKDEKVHYPAVAKSSWTRTYKRVGTEMNDLNECSRESLFVQHELGWAFRQNDQQAGFLLLNMLENRGNMLMDSAVVIKDAHLLSECNMRQQVAGVWGERNQMTWYCIALYLYEREKAALYRESMEVLKRVKAGDPGARDALLKCYPDGICNKEKF